MANANLDGGAAGGRVDGGMARERSSIGDVDAFLAQCLDDARAQFGLGGERAVHVGEEYADAEVHRVLAEIVENDEGRGMTQDQRALLHHLLQHANDVVGIGEIGNAYRYREPAQQIAVREVDDRVGDELRVRNDEARALEGLDFRRAHGNAPDVSLALFQRDPVAHLDRPLDQQDEPGDEVVDDRLQAETDTDGEGTGDDGEARDIEAGVGDGCQGCDGEADVSGTGIDRVGKPGLEASLR